MPANHALSTDELDPEDFHALVVYEATRILQTLAWEEIHRNNRQSEEFIVFCLEGDSSWGRLIEDVEERSDWKKVQSQKTRATICRSLSVDLIANCMRCRSAHRWVLLFCFYLIIEWEYF